jgi:hypothetical protein
MWQGVGSMSGRVGQRGSGPPRRRRRRGLWASHGLALLLASLSLPRADAQWAARPHWEMRPCMPALESTQGQPGNATVYNPACHFLPGLQEDGAYGKPLRDSVDLEWDPAFVRSLENDNPPLFKAIKNNKIRIGVDTSADGGMDLTLPLAGSRAATPWDEAAMKAECAPSLHPLPPCISVMIH